VIPKVQREQEQDKLMEINYIGKFNLSVIEAIPARDDFLIRKIDPIYVNNLKNEILNNQWGILFRPSFVINISDKKKNEKEDYSEECFQNLYFQLKENPKEDFINSVIILGFENLHLFIRYNSLYYHQISAATTFCGSFLEVMFSTLPPAPPLNHPILKKNAIRCAADVATLRIGPQYDWHQLLPVYTGAGGPITHPSVWKLFHLKTEPAPYNDQQIDPVHTKLQRFQFSFDGNFPPAPVVPPVPFTTATAIWSLHDVNQQNRVILLTCDTWRTNFNCTVYAPYHEGVIDFEHLSSGPIGMFANNFIGFPHDMYHIFQQMAAFVDQLAH
jgi:hypothetical protein